jgi:triosephosphate isomerase
MRKQIAAANWKMNLTLEEGLALTEKIFQQPLSLAENHLVLIAVPFPYLLSVQEKIGDKENVFVAAQNCSAKNNGAFTGEVSAAILKSIAVKYVLVGHSERREHQHETNAELAEKVNRCLEQGLVPVFCCGEPLQIREADTHNSYVANQISESLFHLSSDQMNGFIIAYEPIWAIGTGKTATSQQAQEMHLNIRNVIAAKYGKEVADSVSVLYGGSVKGSNAAEIFSQPDVDGGLVGGASLVAEEFSTIIKSLKK